MPSSTRSWTTGKYSHGRTVAEFEAALGQWTGAAHVVGANSGTDALVLLLSFFPTKTLGAIGDAGAVLTHDPQVASTAAALRHHGRFGPTLDNVTLIWPATGVVGVTSTMDDIQAAVLTATLTRLKENIARRDRLADAYTEGTETSYPRPLHLQPCVAGLGDARGDFPPAEAACDHAIALPLYPDCPCASCSGSAS